jgi:hypothetical protein
MHTHTTTANCTPPPPQEIDALLDVDHDHVVPLHEYYRQGNRLYLIMELLRGGELLEALQEVVSLLGGGVSASGAVRVCGGGSCSGWQS